MKSLSNCLISSHSSCYKSNNSTYDSPLFFDSLEISKNPEIMETEIRIIQYLNGLGLENKTDPVLKENNYWNQKKCQTQKRMSSLLGQNDTNLSNRSSFSLNTYANKLLVKRMAQSCPETPNEKTNMFLFLEI